MIVYPPQQQVSLFHLALACVVLVLTAYSYLLNNNARWSVSAYMADDLDLTHKMIEKFDIIEEDDIIESKSISTRAAEGQPSQEQANHLDAISLLERTVKKVHFSSLGRRFNLILGKPTDLVTNDFTVITLDGQGKPTIVPYNRNSINVLDGIVSGDSRSKAIASFSDKDKLMTAQIRSGQDIIIVEPTYLHKGSLWTTSTNGSDKIDSSSKLYDKTMIVYNLRDHKQFKDANNATFGSDLFNPQNLCASLNMSEYDKNSITSDPSSIKVRDPELDEVFKIYKSPKNNKKRVRRGLESLIGENKEKTRCTLHLVADYLFYKYVGKGDLQTTVNYLLALVHRVNEIYLPIVWDTGEEGAEGPTNIGFTVQNITIHQEFTRISSNEIHYNMLSSRVWSAREFLDNFSQHSPPRHYCLAHLLTYRQFDAPVLGLAYVASTRYGTIGGICSPTQQKGDIFYKHNTGISTSKGINGETLITRQADLVVAHELAHNLGAEHDSNECRPPPSQGGAYLMHPYAVMGFEKNNRFLSNCSRLSIGRVIKRKAPTCFVPVVDQVCGNGIKEDGEDCDGGDFGHGHNDPCCDSLCRFTPGSQCSERHSWCCSKCRISLAGFKCRPAEQHICKQESYCNGQTADCPDSPPAEDNSVCVGRGVCRKGDCVPFCENRELHSCLCQDSANACKLCCKASLNGTCVPYDDKAPYLPDGVLCYKGICEKGRCEQAIQDVVERLWDVIEDISLSTVLKFLRDNIILVVLVVSIPIWCICSHYINEFDKRFKTDVMTAIVRNRGGRREPPSPSPFLPRLFVGDEISNPASAENVNVETYCLKHFNDHK